MVNRWYRRRRLPLLDQFRREPHVKQMALQTSNRLRTGKSRCPFNANVFVSKNSRSATRRCSHRSDGDIGPMHHEIMTELRAIRAQMAAAPARRRRRRHQADRRVGHREVAEAQGAAGNLPRPDRAVREAQGRTRPDSRRHQPHQAGNRGAARQELQRRGDGQGQWRTRRRGRRHRGSDPADSGSRRGDRPGRQRARQGEFAGSAEAAQRGNPGARHLDLRGLQFPGSDRSAHQQGDDHDEVHRKPHHRR